MRGLSCFFVAMFLIVVSACGPKGKSKNAEDVYGIDTTLAKTTVQFIAVEHDFGQVNEGEKVTHVYEMLNTGNADLLLQNVKPSCGCTTPKYDKKPIRPGKKGSIQVVFNTKGRPGKQRKSVTVVTNTEPSNTVLSFTCEVMPAKE